MEYGAPSVSPANSQLPDFFGYFYLLEGAQLFWKANRFSACQEIPRIFWNRRYITAFTSASHVSLSWASSIQSKPPYHTSRISILIFSSLYVRVFQMSPAIFLAEII